MNKRKNAGTLDEYMRTLDPVDQSRINFLMSIMATIIEARKAKGLSQKELAQMVGMKQPAIARLESLKVTPKVDTLFTVLDALDYEIHISPKIEPRLSTAAHNV